MWLRYGSGLLMVGMLWGCATVNSTSSPGSAPLFQADATDTAILQAVQRVQSIAAVLDDKRPSFRPAIFGFAALATLVVAGGAAIQLTGRSAHDAIGGVGGPLELRPPHMGFLRVVAAPWAEVAIDGQPVDTTPFARPVPLSAGTHYVTLTHPNARAEKRVVRIRDGEATLLDVTLEVSGFDDPYDAGKEGGGR